MVLIEVPDYDPQKIPSLAEAHYIGRQLARQGRAWYMKRKIVVTLEPRRDSSVTQPPPVCNTVPFQQGLWPCQYCQKSNHNQARYSEYQSDLVLQRIKIQDRLVYLPSQYEPIRVAL